MRTRKFLLATAAAALGVGLFVGGAQAQNGYGTPAAVGDPLSPETVYVHPIPDRIHRSSVRPGMNGYLYSQQISASRTVDFADINLSRPAGWRMLRLRIADTARDLCAGLQNTDRWNVDRDEFRSCVTKATNNAMRDVSLS
jgi:UrcA family protein